MINESEKKELLSAILSSPDFRDAQRYQKLLIYLVETTLRGETVKEITIAHEIFGKDSKFNPGEDPSVRVYVSNLRKKLEHYFLTSENKYSYTLEIPKGQYSVQFVPVKQNKMSTKTRRHDYLIFIPIIFALIAVIVFQWLNKSSTNSPTQNSLIQNPIWTEFIQPNSRPTIVVLGDYFFLFEKTNKPSGGNFVRDPRINSEEDFRVLLKQNPNLINQFVISNFTYLRPSATWGLSEILPLLWNSPNKIFLKLASQFKWEDFQTHNVIFIGSFKTLYVLKKLLPTFNLRYNVNPPSMSAINNEGDTIQTFNPRDLIGGNYQKDYGVILKLVGPNNNIIMFLIGFDEVGVIEAAKASADLGLYNTISKKYNLEKVTSPFLFELVLEAEGIEQTGFKSEVKFFSKIEPSRMEGLQKK
jgi:hypothetical protein